MRFAIDSVSEISNFIENLKFESPLSVPDYNRTFRQAYRQVHALLLWNEILSLRKSKPNADALLNFRELLSDLASAQMLLLCGMYKPTRMMLRSSIENILRVAAHEQGFLAEGTRFTYELITLVRSSRIGSDASPVKADLSSIIDRYSGLCAYTHAASESFMALRVPFIKATVFEESEFTSLVGELKILASRYNRLMFTLYYKPLTLAQHRDRDFILDSIPKTLKKHMSSQD